MNNNNVNLDLNGLKEDEKSMLQMYLDGKNYAEIGMIFHLTSERVRRIVSSAYRKAHRRACMEEAREAGEAKEETYEIDSLQLSAHTLRSLKKHSIYTIEQLKSINESMVIEMFRNPTTVVEILTLKTSLGNLK